MDSRRQFATSLFLSAAFLFAASLKSSALQITCEHAVAPEMKEVFLYVTLANNEDKAVDVMTVMPNALVMIRGGIWMLFLQPTWYAEDMGRDEFPLRERLLPITLKPGQRTTFVHQIQTGELLQSSPLTKGTLVTVTYKVGPKDAARYKVWGGEIAANSVYVPFYEKK